MKIFWLKTAVAFMLAHPYGTPRVMSSFAFTHHDQGPPADANEEILSPVILSDGICGNPWVCEHRWRQVYGMADFRNQVGKANLNNWWDNGSNQIAFCRGNRGFFAANIDNKNLNQTFNVCLPPGTYCDVITGESINGKCTGKSVLVNDKGEAHIEINTNEENQVLAIHWRARL